MRAVVIHGKEDIRVEEVPTPKPGPGEVLMRVAYAGICGSDLHYYFEGANGEFKVREPLIPGHEVCGVVAEDPDGKFAPGTPITLHPATFGTSLPGIEDEPHLWPNGAYLGSASTMPHTQGGMSEYLLLRHDQVRVLPDDLSMKRAVLSEPTAVGLHAVHRAGDLKGKKVLVSGAGPIGLLTAGAALANGAEDLWVCDLFEKPLQRATSLGVAGTINVTETPLEAESFDVVLECSGAFPAMSSAINAVRRRGLVVQVGMVPGGDIPIALAPLISKEATMLGVFRFRDEVDDAIYVLRDNPQLENVLTHIIATDDAEGAFEIARDSRESGKVAVNLWYED